MIAVSRLRSGFAQRAGAFTLASTSSSSAPLHTSAVVHAARTAQELRQRRKARTEKRQLQERIRELTKPDPVLGHQLNAEGESLWHNCELKNVILTKDAVWGVGEDRRGNLVELDDDVHADDATLGPKRLNFGLDNENDRTLLFANLPAVIIEDSARTESVASLGTDQLDFVSRKMESDEEVEREHANLLGRILDLRNASGKGIQVENIRRIVHHFGARKNADGSTTLDTGAPEVQAAVLTYRIRNLYEHLEHARHDNSNRRSMSLLIHQRAKMLKYLKRKSYDRYQSILPRLGIESRAVEGEIVVPGKPRMKTMVQ